MEEPKARSFHGQRGVFRFDSIEIKLRHFEAQDHLRVVPSLNFSDLNDMDIVIFSQ